MKKTIMLIVAVFVMAGLFSHFTVEKTLKTQKESLNQEEKKKPVAVSFRIKEVSIAQ